MTISDYSNNINNNHNSSNVILWLSLQYVIHTSFQEINVDDIKYYIFLMTIRRNYNKLGWWCLCKVKMSMKAISTTDKPILCKRAVIMSNYANGQTNKQWLKHKSWNKIRACTNSSFQIPTISIMCLAFNFPTPSSLNHLSLSQHRLTSSLF